MNKGTKIVLPEEFEQMCDFMDVSPRAFLEKFVCNVLSYDEVYDPDGAEIALAIRYFLTYSANRNRIYERQVLIRDAFINKTGLKLKRFLFDLNENDGVAMGTDLQEFLADWKGKWKKVNEVWHGDKEDFAEQEAENNSVTQDEFVETRDIQPFESISIDTVTDIILQKGDKESVRIESKEDMAHIIQTIIENKQLRIFIRNDSFDVIPYAAIYITYSTLNGLIVDHSGSITCAEPIQCERLGIVQNGKGDIDLQVDVISLDATVTKRGNLKISGSAEEAKIMNTGPGSFVGINLATSEARITIKDSGGISIRVEEELVCKLLGSGDLLFGGEPRIKSLSVSGAGTLKHYQQKEKEL